MPASSRRSGACFPRSHLSTRSNGRQADQVSIAKIPTPFLYIARITAHHDMLSASSFFYFVLTPCFTSCVMSRSVFIGSLGPPRPSFVADWDGFFFGLHYTQRSYFPCCVDHREDEMGPGETLADLCGTAPRPGPERAEKGEIRREAGEAALTGQYCVDGVETWWCLGRSGRREVASLRLMQYTPQEMIRRRCLFRSHLVLSTCVSLQGAYIALASDGSG